MDLIKPHIPNMLTMFRIPLAFLCAYFAFFKEDPFSLSVSLGLFLLAAITDAVDGHLARRWKIVSKFGKIWDPIADKILILGVLVVFTYNGIVPLILTLLIVAREVLLTVIRLMLLSKKIVLAARQSGKFKTISQVAVLISIYCLLIFDHPLQAYISKDVISWIIFSLLIWKAGITLYSGIEFILHNRKVIGKIEWV